MVFSCHFIGGSHAIAFVYRVRTGYFAFGNKANSYNRLFRYRLENMEVTMIFVSIKPNSIEVSGHAMRPDGVPPGQNIVCAAVSALVLNLTDTLQAIAQMDLTVEEDAGHVLIKWHDMTLKGIALIDAWFLGILSIRDAYGEIEII